MWDTGGRESFRTILTSYYRGAHGVFILLDLTIKNSIDSVKSYYETVSKYGSEYVQIVLIGTKSDLVVS